LGDEADSGSGAEESAVAEGSAAAAAGLKASVLELERAAETAETERTK
jgi:hypothetical protein